jgi:hypothetical protein
MKVKVGPRARKMRLVQAEECLGLSKGKKFKGWSKGKKVEVGPMASS